MQTFDFQMLFNVFVGLISFICGWILKRVFQSLDKHDDLIKAIEDHRNNDFRVASDKTEQNYKEIVNKFTDLSIVLANTYVTKNDLREISTQMKDGFDRLDGKFDKIQTEFLSKK